MSSDQVKVLIVCLGNICRSPMGEAVMRDIAKQRGHDIVLDSAGTGAYHEGEDPDDRAVATCQKHKIPISHAARKVRTSDYTAFTHILAADGNNLNSLRRNAPRNATATIRLWGSYLESNLPISDPYYGGNSGFERVYQQCVALSNAFLDDVFGPQS
ncbi:phosphotyrosine protein phosphatase [Armillaria luteobubalina]|uniref:Phosphotyrosine protein phosphatase n=1 Tax=Armillaria luteobubalina TaxID=153913 RepID=A0AA39V0Q1_9AGAR|nr:phosphotyrosine protein phosphatase [Armillaria luteobubalina]